MRAPKLVEKPVKLPVTIDDVKNYCGVTGSDQDMRLQLLMDSATEKLDGYRGRLGRCIIDQRWSQDFGPCERLRLVFPDVKEATAEWIDADGQATAATVVLDGDVISPFVRVVTGLDRGRVLRVTFTAGFGPEPEDVPAPIREAILIDVDHRLRTSSEDGQIRSETVEGVGVTAFNSPEQTSLGVERQIIDLLRVYRRGNV